MTNIPEDPDFSEYLESENSNFRFLGKLLNTINNESIDRGHKMPDLKLFYQEEYHLEPRIYPLYKQAYISTLIGFDRSSLILQGVLLEQMLKELYYVENGNEIEEDMNNPGLYDVLEEFENILSDESYQFIDEFRDNIRNNWIHDNNKKIAGETKIPARKVSLQNEPGNWAEKISETSRKLLDEELGYEDQRFIGDIIMAKLDKNALQLFLSTDSAVREISELIMKRSK